MRQNQYLDYLIEPSFQGINRHFSLSFENEIQTTSYKQFYLPTVEIKDYNVMIDGQNFFHQPVRNNLKTYGSIRTNATVQGGDYTTGCLLHYSHFKICYNVIVVDLSEEQSLNADPKTIQQINFTGNLDPAVGEAMFLIIEEAKETVLNFSQETVKVF